MVTVIRVMTTISLADAKAHLSAVLDEVRDTHERVVITRNGRPEVVVLSVSDLEALEETLDLLSTPGALDEIRAAETEIARGGAIGAEELRGLMDQRTRAEQSDEAHTLSLASTARRAVVERPPRGLPLAVATAVTEFMTRPLLDDPHRVGKPLTRELAGYHSARRGAYRVIYRIDETGRTVHVVRVDHRADVYRTR
jgi:prevent-host-death family protein